MRNDDMTHLVVALREILGQLEPREYQAVRMRFADGMPIALIARKLKMPRRTVTLLVGRVRRALTEG